MQLCTCDAPVACPCGEGETCSCPVPCAACGELFADAVYTAHAPDCADPGECDLCGPRLAAERHLHELKRTTWPWAASTEAELAEHDARVDAVMRSLEPAPKEPGVASSDLLSDEGKPAAAPGAPKEAA